MKNALKIDKNWKFGYPDLINPDFGQSGYPDFNSAKNVLILYWHEFLLLIHWSKFEYYCKNHYLNDLTKERLQ